jgi:uncharacterized membrane protein
VDRGERPCGFFRWDPYPFILLNLACSTQAAYAAPLTQQDKALTEKIEALTREIHARLPAG